MAAPAAMFRGARRGHYCGMAKPLSSTIALCSMIALGNDAGVPDWIHLIPAGEVVTNDGRGPYRITDAVALMATSLKAGDKLVLDENHATDLAAPEGREAPARGWIVELQHRGDGIWGRVEWTGPGRARMENREYRGVSPVIAHRKDGTITQVLRASLVNAPNFQGLTALHQEEATHMDFRAKLIEALGLGSDADDAAIMAAIKAKLDGGAEATATALQSALSPIAAIVGLDATADAAAILSSVTKLKEGDAGTVTELQSQVVGLTGQVKSLQDDAKKTSATAYVDAEIARGRVGLKPQRDEYIALHQENPDRAVKLIGAMPVLKSGAQLSDLPSTVAGGEDDPVQIAAHARTYQKKQADAGLTIDFASSVRAVMEGKHK